MNDRGNSAPSFNPSGDLVSNAKERGCYCGLWRTSPETLIEQGLPKGFCGLCEICKQPGHTRHFPGPVARTGSWCDRHHLLATLLHPMEFTGRKVWRVIGILMIIAYAIWH